MWNYLKRTHNEEHFCKVWRGCRQEQFRLCVSSGSVHLASVLPSETFRVQCRAHADWISPVSPVAAGNTSTVHSSSTGAGLLPTRHCSEKRDGVWRWNVSQPGSYLSPTNQASLIWRSYFPTCRAFSLSRWRQRATCWMSNEWRIILVDLRAACFGNQPTDFRRNRPNFVEFPAPAAFSDNWSRGGSYGEINYLGGLFVRKSDRAERRKSLNFHQYAWPYWYLHQLSVLFSLVSHPRNVINVYNYELQWVTTK